MAFNSICNLPYINDFINLCGDILHWISKYFSSLIHLSKTEFYIKILSLIYLTVSLFPGGKNGMHLAFKNGRNIVKNLFVK